MDYRRYRHDRLHHQRALLWTALVLLGLAAALLFHQELAHWAATVWAKWWPSLPVRPLAEGFKTVRGVWY